MRGASIKSITAGVLLFCTSLWVQAEYRIEPVTDHLYRFTDERHHSVFMVTDKGILLTDPQNPKAARWLKAELDKRFGVPVRYVVYSHNHSDHIYGGRVFDAPGTVFISHRLAAEDMRVTAADTRWPDITFDKFLTLSLGNRTLELRYHGPNDGRGSVSMLFKEDRTVFVVDWIVLGRMPWRKLWSYDIRGMIDSTRQVLALDFDRFVGGHGKIGTPEEVRQYLNYLTELQTAVIEGIREGKSLETLQQEIKVPAYKHTPFYDDWLPLNIEGVYERMKEESGMGWRPDVP